MPHLVGCLSNLWRLVFKNKYAIFYRIVVSNVCTKVDYYSDYFKDDCHFKRISSVAVMMWIWYFGIIIAREHWPDTCEFITQTVELCKRWIRLLCYYNRVYTSCPLLTQFYSLQLISIYKRQYCPCAYITQTHIYILNADFQLWHNSTKTRM